MGQIQKYAFLLHPPRNFGLMVSVGSHAIYDHIFTCCHLHNLGSNFDNSFL